MFDLDQGLRTQPRNLEAERAVIGSCLIDNSVLAEVCDLLEPADFFDPPNRDAFEAVKTMQAHGDPVDILLLAEALRNRGLYEQAGGQGYLASLVEQVSTSGSALYYAGIVKEKSLRRQLIAAGGMMVNDCFDETRSTDDVIQAAEKSVFDVARGRQEGHFTSLSDAANGALGQLTAKIADRSFGLGVSTGFPDVDHKLHGLQSGSLIILAARPAMGKSALAMNIALNVAMGKGAGRYGGERSGVLVFSLEMSAEQLATRLIGSESRVELSKVYSGDIASGSEEWVRLNKTVGALSELDLEIDDSSMLTIAELRARVRRFAARRTGRHLASGHHPLGLVVVDYLQLLSGVKNLDNKVHEIGEISRGLKAIAREFDVPVLALSQLSRAVELRTDRRPQLSDLRDSGAIEQDADQVCFLYRESYYRNGDQSVDPADGPDLTAALLDVAKNRSGATGAVNLRFFREYTRFESYMDDNKYGPCPDNK